MRKNTLLMSAAVATVIAGGGVAFAQSPSPAPPAQRQAPAEKMAPSQDAKDAVKHRAPDAGMKSRQAEEKMTPNGGGALRAQDNTKGDAKSKDANSEPRSSGAASSDKTKADPKADARRSDKNGASKTETTGQGAAGAIAKKLTTEQRTTIRTVVKRNNVRPITKVNFSISLGTAVPATVHFYPVPVELVQINPQWRGYNYILVGDQIIVVNPQTRLIVAVLDV